MKKPYGLNKREISELELVIIGAGAAGISAAIYCSLMDINYVLLDAEEGGGLLNLAKKVENLAGVTGKHGPEIVHDMQEHLRLVGGKIRCYEPARRLKFQPGELMVQTSQETYHPKTVIVATGLEVLGLSEEFGIKDERKFLGRGISYCAECDAPLFRNKKVLVCGNPFDAFLLKRLTDSVIYLGPVPDEFSNQVPREIIEANNIRYIEGNIEELRGEPYLQEVVIGGRALPVEGVFLTKRRSSAHVFARAGLELDDDGFITCDRSMATNVAGVFAAGDITGEPWQIAKSIGEGAVAALSVFKFLTGQQMRNLGWALQDEWQD
jgi:thioredoxin reductase (NADPH)